LRGYILDINVGQVVFLLSNKEARVFPALVTEQIDKKTMVGREKHYVVKLPNKEMSEVPLSKIDAQVFKSIESARDEMVSRATSQINRILKKATEVSQVFKDFQVHDPVENLIDNIENRKYSEALGNQSEKDENIATVDLGNGVIGKVNLDNFSI